MNVETGELQLEGIYGLRVSVLLYSPRLRSLCQEYHEGWLLCLPNGMCYDSRASGYELSAQGLDCGEPHYPAEGSRFRSLQSGPQQRELDSAGSPLRGTSAHALMVSAQTCPVR